ERELRAELPARILHVECEVLFRALAPQLAHAAVGRHPVVVVETEGRRVDDRPVADGKEDGNAEQPSRDRGRNERVLVLRMDHVRASPLRCTEDSERRPGVEERVREPLRGRRTPSRLELLGKGEPDDADAVGFLAWRGAPVRCHDRYAVAAPGQGTGERLQTPLGPAWRERGEVLVDEANVHGRTRVTTRNPVDS